jgi:DNA-binding NtrC family response regulator
MPVRALKFMPGQPPLRPVRSHIAVETAQAFEAVKKETLPVAFLLSQADLSVVTKYKSLVVDRGRKHPAKGLSALLMGWDKVPSIFVDYRNAGQLRRSIRTLLANAVKVGEQNLFIIGVNDHMFQNLWNNAGEKPRDQRPSPLRTQPLSSRWPLHEGEAISSDLILDLMDRYEEPGELSARYVGTSAEIRLVRQLILRSAEMENIVLILGDTGTGKDLVARLIHDYSTRRTGQFVAVNCGAIPRELFESEVFGHEKGSFTGATHRKPGLWQAADNGTLFLDEIGDLHEEHQVKILRALQEGKIRPVGSDREIRVNARVIAATNRELFSMVETKQFREDLYYRLREFLIRTPPLRRRPDDIPVLAQMFWRRITRDEKSRLSKEIVQGLCSYRWPGNARELKAVLNHLFTLFGKGHLRSRHLEAIFLLQGQTASQKDHVYSWKRLESRQVHSLDHLQRLQEVLRATEVAFIPLLEEDSPNRFAFDSMVELLRYRLSELEILCLQPLLFDSERTFSLVNEFKGKLLYFQSLLSTDTTEAIQFGRKVLIQGFRDLQADLTKKLGILAGAPS